MTIVESADAIGGGA